MELGPQAADALGLCAHQALCESILVLNARNNYCTITVD